MGNLSYIIPTENKEEFNRNSITKLLQEKFPDFVIQSNDEWDQIEVTTMDGDGVVSMYFNPECYLLEDGEFKNSISELRNRVDHWQNGEQLADRLEELRKTNPDLSKTMQMTHCNNFRLREDKRQMEIYLHSYFKSFIFDEGIHPEYLPPDYVWRPVRKQKRFLGFKL